MATLVDLPSDDETDNNEYLELVETEAPAEEQPAEVEASEEDSLPEKYRGKTAAELAEMHANLERLMGKQSEEVGELRKAFDNMVKDSIVSNRNQQQSAPEPSVEDDIDYWADPKSAIERTLQNHPTIKNAERVAIEMAKKESIAALQSAHPDMKEILADEAFKQWVQKSEIRTALYQDADQNYNYKAANELFDLWKERKGIVEQTKQVEKAAQKQEVRKAATGSSRSNPDGQTTKKVYRRRDIIELMNRDPKRYEALQPEIMKAYAEGRVK
jgi:hypothetical protein